MRTVWSCLSSGQKFPVFHFSACFPTVTAEVCEGVPQWCEQTKFCTRWRQSWGLGFIYDTEYKEWTAKGRDRSKTRAFTFSERCIYIFTATYHNGRNGIIRSDAKFSEAQLHIGVWLLLDCIYRWSQPSIYFPSSFTRSDIGQTQGAKGHLLGIISLYI